MDPQLSQRVGRLMSTPTITAIKRSTQQLMSFLSEVEGASSFEDLPPRTKIVILRAETEQRDIDDELRSLSTRRKRKYNTAHDTRGRFASTGSSPWHKSTEAPAGLTHANAVEREDAQAGLHITRNQSVSDTQVRSGAKAMLVAQVTERVHKDKAAMAALGNPSYDELSKTVNRQVRPWSEMAKRIKGGGGQYESSDPESLLHSVNAIYAKHGAGQRAIARHMYENTQDQLKKEGIDSVLLYRGVNFSAGKAPKWTQYGRRRNIALQPISSFTSNVEIALRFSGTSSSSYSAHIIAMEVPRERIFSTARTGNGCLNEYEYVVLGGVSPGRNLKVGQGSGVSFSGNKVTLKPPGKEGY
jgi:hypothetical protein